MTCSFINITTKCQNKLYHFRMNDIIKKDDIPQNSTLLIIKILLE